MLLNIGNISSICCVAFAKRMTTSTNTAKIHHHPKFGVTQKFKRRVLLLLPISPPLDMPALYVQCTLYTIHIFVYMHIIDIVHCGRCCCFCCRQQQSRRAGRQNWHRLATNQHTWEDVRASYCVYKMNMIFSAITPMVSHTYVFSHITPTYHITFNTYTPRAPMCACVALCCCNTIPIAHFNRCRCIVARPK